ncbi:MAG: GspH/FimT family pseudopilin [Thiobacillus sp.]
MVYAPATTRGFTLIELMVTLSVLAILLAVAIPNYQIFVVSSRVASQANDMVASLSLARSEAVKRSANVTVCASSDGATCTGTWTQGWVVLDGAGNVLRMQPAIGGSSTLTGAGTIVFNANGRMTTPVAATTLTLSSGAAGVANRLIQIELTGRARACVVGPNCP